jgi:hypothetical protein
MDGNDTTRTEVREAKVSKLEALTALQTQTLKLVAQLQPLTDVAALIEVAFLEAIEVETKATIKQAKERAKERAKGQSADS